MSKKSSTETNSWNSTLLGREQRKHLDHRISNISGQAYKQLRPPDPPNVARARAVVKKHDEVIRKAHERRQSGIHAACRAARSEVLFAKSADTARVVVDQLEAKVKRRGWLLDP